MSKAPLSNGKSAFRPASPLPNPYLFLVALHFGATRHTAAIAVPGESQWRAYRRALAPPTPDSAIDLAIMRSLMKDLLRGLRPAAIGVSCSGTVDFDTGIVRHRAPARGWDDLPLQQMLEQEFNVPVWIDNTANLSALGEHRFGVGQASDSLLYINVNTSIEGGWILNRQLWRGAEGTAGEIGHLVVDSNGPVCRCGKRGCVERYASGSAIAQQMREKLETHVNRSQLLRQMLGSHLKTITGQRVSNAAAEGDELAWEVLEKAAWALGQAIGHIANLINPQQFVLEGNITKSGEQFWQVMRCTAAETALPGVAIDIVPATLGDDAPLWGAVVLAEEVLRKQ